MRRVLAVLSSVAVGFGVLVGVAAPARAADLGTVTVSYSSFVYSVSPEALDGAVGDTFTLANTLTSGDDDPLYYVSLMNDSGAVSLSGTSCVLSTSCKVLDLFSGSATGLFTVTSTGTVNVMRVYNGGAASQLGTITIGGSASGPTDPALVYPTLNLNANGGTCSGTMQFTKYNGQNGTVTLPTGDTCTREGYTLAGWARTADATSSAFAAGSTVPIGDESFALYAVWRPDGVQVTYDANVGANDVCLASGIPTDVRTSTSVVPVGSATATSAPCTPGDMVLAGWALTGDGAVAVQPEGALPADWTSGSSHRLYAKWKVTYGVSITSAPTSMAPNSSATITVSTKINDAPGPYVVVGVIATGSVSLEDTPVSPFAFSAFNLGMAVDGTATFPIYSRAAGTGTVTVAYGNVTSRVTIPVVEPVTKSITLTGERTTVSGKPGIRLDGATEGFAAGDMVVPWFRFPGQTEYSQGSARPAIDGRGKVVWERKTGKKFYAYLTSEDGSVTSNRVIIPAK